MHYVRMMRRSEKRMDGEIMSYFTQLQDSFYVVATSVICIHNILQGIATYIVIAWLRILCKQPSMH